MPSHDNWFNTECDMAAALAYVLASRPLSAKEVPPQYQGTRVQFPKSGAYKYVADQINAAHPWGDPRTWKAVEQKLCNVSAILVDFGRDKLPGLPPRNNYQAVMVAAVACAFGIPEKALLTKCNAARQSRGQKTFKLADLHENAAALDSAESREVAGPDIRHGNSK